MERVGKRKALDTYSRDEGEDSRDSPQSDNTEIELNEQRKKQRAKLNFSIESIMRSEATRIEQPKQQDSNRAHQQQLNDNDDDDNDDEDDDDNNNNHNNNHNTHSLSPTCSTNSSLDSDVEVEHLAPNNQVQHHRQQRQHHFQAGTSLASSSLNRIHGTPSAAAVKAESTTTLTNNNTSSPASSSINRSLSVESHLSQVECQLDNKAMWDRFHSLNTEMIITKTGRRMFPVMKVQFHNLNPNARYSVMMDIVPVDNKRYRYAYHKSCWQVAGKADPSAETRLYPHPDSPFNGDLLSRQVISFEKVKLTNNEMDKSGHIILNSMHKYQPRVHLFELNDPPPLDTTTTTGTTTTSTLPLSSARRSTSSSSSVSDHHSHNHHHMINKHHQQHHNQHHTTNHHHHNHNHHHHQQQHQHQHQQHNSNNASHSGSKDYRTFVFPETVFTAVTAYQNQLITKEKIDKNPFAKGFRDSSRLSDLDRNDPFEYMGPLGPSGRFVNQPGRPGSLEAAAAAGAAHMDAYQLLASAANNPWYSAAAVAAATSQSAASNPFNPMVGSTACSTAQQAQFQATQMLLAAFTACLNNGGNSSGSGGGIVGTGGGVGSGVGMGGTGAQGGPDQ